MTEGADRLRCAAVTRSGEQCRGKALPDREHCAVHSPEAIEGRRRGGVNHSNARRSLRVMPPDLQEIATLVSVAIRQVHDGELPPQRLSAMSAGTAALCRVLEVALLRAEVTALREQIEALQVQRAIEGGYRQ